ncbi:HdeD family acid-resistance protein [Nonomuraea terrae]|uniref:HdeD family acid-resistance protein n=1 Tax=Nonomuraea terrae TaxID=2530383 RepID=A0A4R4Y5J4_9ACTN|nr:HdeD family acid-resistance protein [Nonomuraea terrae]TDD38222.1 HdeD family acid-resistance protein [Nonomuraea terrae]
MVDVSRSWWLLLLRGLAAVVFGFLALLWPGITVLALVAFFGAYALVSGIFALFAGFRHATRSRAWLIVTGVIGILAGIVALVWPGITSLALLYVVAVWAVFSGVAEIAAGIHLRKVIHNEWAFIVAGALSVLVGVLLIIWPGAGLVSLAWLVGVFAILYGIAMIALALRVKNFSNRVDVP